LNEIFTKARQKYNLNEGGTFYDLGSGIGKAVISAGLLHNFDVCAGIELIPSLYSLSLQLQQKYLKRKIKYP
jgi:Histone methylation protein DOT1.